MFSKKIAVVEPVSMSREPETIPAAKTCPECGKFHRREDLRCAGCELTAMIATEPKQSPDRCPCGICGVTHISGEWVKKPISVHNRPQFVYLCTACADVRNRDLAPALGATVEETILAVRVLQEYGHSQPWRKRGADPWIRKTIVREAMGLSGDTRPRHAAELASWGPTDEPRDACRFLKLNASTIARIIGSTPHRARAVGHAHQVRTIENLLWDAAVIARGDEPEPLSTYERMRSGVPLAAQLQAANQGAP